MSGRVWKDWEIALTKEIMLKYRAEGKKVELAARHLENRLDNRTAAAINWYWHNRIATMDGVAEEIGQADAQAEKLKSGKQVKQKKQWYQANVAKVVTLPHEVVTEIEKIKSTGDGSGLYNLMELSTNPVLSAFLSDAKNTQLYFKGLDVGYKPDKTGEELILDRMEEYARQGRVTVVNGIIETLELLGRTDILEKIKGANE